MSLRWRISLGFAVGAAAMALVFGALVYERTASNRAAHARSLQIQRAQIAEQLYADTGRLAFEATVNDPSAPAALRWAVDSGELASFLGKARGRPVVWAGAPIRGGGGGVFVSTSFAPEAQALAALRRSLVEVGVLVTLVMALLGLLFAWRLSARLRSAARIAGQIGAGEPGARIEMSGRDEVAALAGTVDRMADSLRERIERERRFTADVAHELRTPISGLVAAGALLDDSEPAAMVRDRTQRLARLVEDLLEISRLEAGVEQPVHRNVGLASLARSVCADRPVRICGRGGQVISDPRRLARIISNLVDNACRHGAPPVVIEVHEDRVRVSDNGGGFSADMLAHATERFASGSDARAGGTGLGLAIAAAQADVIGASLRLENEPGGGAVVTILLPDLHETATSGP